MIVTAAIWYTCYQNAPSDPELLPLDVPTDATREQIAACLSGIFLNENKPEEDEEDDRLPFPVEPVVKFGDGTGDVSVTVDEDSWLFVTLPHDVADRLGLRPHTPGGSGDELVTVTVTEKPNTVTVEARGRKSFGRWNNSGSVFDRFGTGAALLKAAMEAWDGQKTFTLTRNELAERSNGWLAPVS